MYHATSGGADDFHKEAQWVLERAKANGLEDVKFISLPPWRTSENTVPAIRTPS